MQLDFKPLSHAPWLMNAVVPVNKHVQLSVTYNGSPGMWYAGDKDDYEAAVQMIDPCRYPGVACVVFFKDNKNDNVFPHTNESGLQGLVARGKELKYYGAIEVCDERGSDKEKIWGVCFLCAEGHDYQQKMKYSKSMFGKDNCRFVEAGNMTGFMVPADSNGEVGCSRCPIAKETNEE